MDYFRNSYKYEWRNTQSIDDLKLNQNVAVSQNINFTIPTLMCQALSSDGAWIDLAEMNTITRIYRQDVINGVIQPQKTLVMDPIISGGTSFVARNDDFAEVTGGANEILKLRDIREFEQTDGGKFNYNSFRELYSTCSQIAHASPLFNNKTVSFVTEMLNEDQIADGKGYFYSIECECLPDNADGLLISLTAFHWAIRDVSPAGIVTIIKCQAESYTGHVLANASNIKASTSFYCCDMSSTAEGGPFLMKGVKYNAYQLFRKAMLTIDTQIIDNSITGLDEFSKDENGNYIKTGIEYLIIVDPLWKNRLKSTQIFETVLEVKNLWEVFQQIGKYLHAEPFLSFAEEGDDRFVLSFKQLGKNEVSPDNNQRITIFNSQALSQYFSSFDSYVTNLFSPQNLCRQSVVPKCSDGTFLVATDNAQVDVAYSINEIVEFWICYQGEWKDAMRAQVVNDNGETVKLSSKIYEKSIFDILTSEYKVSPSKADSLYFTIGDNKILNLTYVPPTDNPYQVEPMALKKIVRQLFGVPVNNLNYNDLMFEIVYRTQDTVRMTQMKPDMEKFVKNSSYEKYPHHEQFYNQLDKIPDSERFSLNMWGQLVRSGNAIIQCQEHCPVGEEKVEGDLFIFDDMPYYVVETQNEYYNDCILQKVTYSAYWNETSMITSQNSENRMYEVSERSTIRREVRMNDFFKISSEPNTNSSGPRFMNNSMWKKFIKDIIFNDTIVEKDKIKIPNYAYVKFLADNKRDHKGSYGQYIEPQYLFPSSEIDRVDPNNIKPKASKSYSEVIVPVLRFPKKDGLLFEFDMEDNFKAGDYVDTTITGQNVNGNSYFAQQPVRYVDIMGRADLFQFKLFNRNRDEISLGIAMLLTKAPFTPTDEESQVLLGGDKSIALDKDCREALSFNYQISLLDKNIEFITFSNLFGDKHSRLKLMLYSEPLGMFDQIINLANGSIIADDVPYILINDETNNQIKIEITQPIGIDMDNVRSVIWYDDNNGIRDIYLVSNVADLPNNDKLKNRYIYPVFNE